MPKNTPTRIIDSQKARAVAFLGGSGSAGGGVSDHGLLTGLADDDHAQYLRTDGTRTLTGNMAVDASVTIDGVDISAHAANANAHHNQAHVITGSDHTVTGAQYQIVGLTGTNTIGLLTPASSPGANAIVKTDSSSAVTLVDATITSDLFMTGTLDFGTNTIAEDATYLQFAGSKAVRFSQNIGNANWTLYNAGGYTTTGSISITGAAGDLTVGSNVLFVDNSQANVGINMAPDSQFALDINGPLRATYLIGPHAIQLADAICIAHFDGPNPIYSNYQGQADGHMGQPATLIGGAIFRPGKFGKALQTGFYTKNLLSNPSFEGTYSSGVAPSWAAYKTGTATGTRASTIDAYVGSAAQQLTRTGGGASDVWGVTTTSAAIGGTAAAMQVRYKVLSYSAGAVVKMYADFTGGPYGEGANHTIVSADIGKWLTLWDTATVGSTDTCTFYVWIEGANASIVIDAAQVENYNLPTPYCDGSLAGYSSGGVWLAAGTSGTGHGWTGTANASTSERTGTQTRLSTVELPTTGTVMCWAMSSAPLYSAGGSDYFYLLDYAHTAGIILYVRSSGSLGVWCGGSNVINYALNSTNFAPFTWHHIAVTWDYGAQATKLYVDGALVGTGGYQTPVTDGGGWDIGCYGTGEQWLGWIDDFALTSQAMTAEAIRSIYESNAPVFAESSTAGFRATPKQLIWADDEGLWMRNTAGNSVFGIYGGEATKSWGGFTMAPGDLLIGNNAVGSSAILWDQSAGTFGFYGAGNATAQVEVSTSGAITAGAGALALNSGGVQITAPSSLGDIGAYKFLVTGKTISSGTYAYYNSGADTYYCYLYSNSSAIANITTGIGATVGGGGTVKATFSLTNSLGSTSTEYTLTGSTSTWWFGGGSLVYVGIGTAAAPTRAFQVAGGVFAGGEDTGLSGYTQITNSTQGVSSGTGTVKMNGTTARNSTGWLKIYVGTSVKYVPYFDTVTG